MSRHTPRSMLGLAMLLVGTGAECARAAPQMDEQEQRRMKWASDRAVNEFRSNLGQRRAAAKRWRIR